MTSTGRMVRHQLPAVIVGILCVAAALVACQSAPPSQGSPADAAAFKDFLARVQVYVKIHQTAEAALPALKATDLPEIISAHQQALARKIQEARPAAKAGDIFTPGVCDAFRHASQSALGGSRAANARAEAVEEGPDPSMPLAVNGIYPSTQPITQMSPALLAALPALPAEVAYRVVGRSIVLIDVKSNLIVDLARLILPPA
jgi:hypothetical protein